MGQTCRSIFTIRYNAPLPCSRARVHTGQVFLQKRAIDVVILPCAILRLLPFCTEMQRRVYDRIPFGSKKYKLTAKSIYEIYYGFYTSFIFCTYNTYK